MFKVAYGEEGNLHFYGSDDDVSALSKCLDALGKKESEHIEDYISLYDNLLAYVCQMRFPEGEAKDKFKNIRSWLDKHGFYRCPASAQYHESFQGGLLVHTCKVAIEINKLQKLEKFNSVDWSSAILVSLVHDWCKIEQYEPYTRWYKDDNDPTWKSKIEFRRKTPPIPLGHGVTSMYIASRFFKLSVPEALAIRWHMGEYNVADNEMNDLHAANEAYPLVQLIQFADRLSITEY